jgi:hypothetical protein
MHNFVPYHLAYESGHAEEIGVAFFYRLPSYSPSLAASLQILPGSDVVGQSSERDAGTIGTLFFPPLETTFAQSCKEYDLIKYFKIARPVRIIRRSADIDTS